jgi:hypothetical protein
VPHLDFRHLALDAGSMDICISFIAGLFLIGMIKQVVYFVG